MGRLLITDAVAEASADELQAIQARAQRWAEPLRFPPDAEPELTETDLASVEAAYASPDLFFEGASVWRFFEVMDRLPNLRWAHLGFAGIDNPRFGALLDRGVRLSNSPSAAAEPIAHSAMAGLLSLARRLPYFAAAQRERRWERLPPALIANDLSAQTLVVFGLGAIGSEVARLASAFGLHVIGVRRRPAAGGEPVDELVHPDRLDEVLPRADWLLVAANLNAETRGAINAERLALLPPGAHVLNVARGAIIDEPALVAALEAGAIGGAYLDVFAQEPLPAESPLWALPNVIVSPHNSWAATGHPERARVGFLANLEAWLNDEALPDEVFER